MAQKGVWLAATAKVQSLDELPGKIVLSEDGHVSIGLVSKYGEGRFSGLVSFTGPDVCMTKFRDLAGSRPYQVVDLGIDRTSVQVHELGPQNPQDALSHVGSIAISNDGLFLVAKNTQLNQPLLVNLSSGVIGQMVGLQFYVASKWGIRGYRGDEIVFDLEFPSGWNF